MPAPLGIAAITGGAQILGGILGNRAARKENREARKWNLEQWHRQNSYNHPQAQMNRLREAKLNPNLVYQSGANTGNAQSISAAQPANQNYDYVGEGAAATINTYYDTKIKQATWNNLEKQNDVMDAEIVLKGTQAKLNEETTFTNMDKRHFKSQDQFYDLQKKQEQLVAAQLGNQFTKEQIRKAVSEADMKHLELRLRKMGLNQNSPAFIRYMVLKKEQIINKLLKSK